MAITSTKRSRPLWDRDNFVAYMFLSPWLLGLLAFQLVPIVMSLVISFTSWSVLLPPKWIGLANYQEMFTEDRFFWHSIGVTVKYMAFLLPMNIVLGIALALLLNQKLRGMNFFRTLFYAPAVISGVAVSLLWISLLNTEFGAINYILRSIGISDPPHWLESPTWAMPSLLLISVWSVGGSSVIYLSGLQNIPAHLYEAAEVDGAGAWKKFWGITIPMMTPTIFFTLITGLIGGFQVFTTAYVIGGESGGPGRSLLFYLLHLYREAWVRGRMGYAAALAWVLVLIAFAVVFIVFRTSERWVYYETKEKE